MNFYPFHIGDYASATRHLSWDEDMAYRRLMDAYYTREAPIPLDRRQAYRLVLASTPEQRAAVDVVLVEFFIETPDGWANARCETEIMAAAEKREKAAQSARARWSHHRDAGDQAGAMPPDSERNANASPDNANASPQPCEGNAPNPIPNPITNKDKNNGRAKTRATPAVWPEGIPEQLQADFLALRKAKRMPLTQTALDGIAAEASKAGLSLVDALKTCCRRGWASFDSAWVKAGPHTGGGPAGKFDPVAYVNQGRQQEEGNGTDETGGTATIDGQSRRVA